MRTRENTGPGLVQDSAIRLLELVTAELPELLPFAGELLRQSALRFAAIELAKDWGVRLEQLPATVARATAGLDRLVRYRGGWRRVSQVIEAPNVAAIIALAEARLARTPDHRRLGPLVRKLKRLAAKKRTEDRIRSFLNEPGSPIDLEPYGL